MEHPGARHHTSVFYGEGLDVANQTRASGGGEKMFLTSPYIDPLYRSGHYTQVPSAQGYPEEGRGFPKHFAGRLFCSHVPT
jgi:hypothetical protein